MWLKELGDVELFKACARFPGNNTQRNELLIKVISDFFYPISLIVI